MLEEMSGFDKTDYLQNLIDMPDVLYNMRINKKIEKNIIYKEYFKSGFAYRLHSFKLDGSKKQIELFNAIHDRCISTLEPHLFSTGGTQFMEFLKKYESEHPKSISEHPKSIEHSKFISGVMKYVALVFLCGILVIFILKGKFWQAKNKKTLSTMI